MNPRGWAVDGSNVKELRRLELNYFLRHFFFESTLNSMSYFLLRLSAFRIFIYRSDCFLKTAEHATAQIDGRVADRMYEPFFETISDRREVRYGNGERAKGRATEASAAALLGARSPLPGRKTGDSCLRFTSEGNPHDRVTGGRRQHPWRTNVNKQERKHRRLFSRT